MMSVFFVGGVVLANEVILDGSNDQKKAEIKEKIEQKKADLEEKREEKVQAMEKRMERVCENVEARVRTRVNRYENNKNAHMNVFSNMLNRLQRVVDRFKEAKLDTTELEKNVTALEVLIDKLYADHDVFISDLKETQDYACGKSEGEFKAKLGVARKVMPEVRTDIVEIREYYKSTVRPEILDLRSQLEDDDDGQKNEDENEQDEQAEDEKSSQDE